MERVTTRDGQTIELRPCPPWCTGEHPAFDDPESIHISDGFHHYSEPVRIQTSNIVDLFKGQPVVVEMYLKSWVQPLNADPGPTQIGLDTDAPEGATDLTPAEARRIADVLIEFSDQITGPAPMADVHDERP